jgi:hypothetical protein
MTNSIDAIYFKELAEQNPEDVCKRALCRYDDVKKCYDFSVWGDEYAIYPHELKIDRLSNRFQRPHEYLYVFIIHYLLKSKETKLFKEWISEKDIPGGATFFRGPHEIPTNLISSRYSGDIERFRKTCDQLDGIPLNMADAAYVFKITPRIPVAVLYWDGDDEFPPESKILFDKSVTEHLALDIIFALAVDICTRIVRPAD